MVMVMVAMIMMMEVLSSGDGGKVPDIDGEKAMYIDVVAAGQTYRHRHWGSADVDNTTHHRQHDHNSYYRQRLSVLWIGGSWVNDKKREVPI